MGPISIIPYVDASASMFVSSVLLSSGGRLRPVDAAMGTQTAFAVDALRVREAEAVFRSAPYLATDGNALRGGAVTLTVQALLSAEVTGYVDASVTFITRAAVYALGSAVWSAASDAFVQGAIGADGEKTKTGEARLEAIPELLADGFRARGDHVTMLSGASLTSTAQRTAIGSATLSAWATLSVSGGAVRGGAVSFSVEPELLARATGAVDASAIMRAVAAIAATATRALSADSRISVAGSLFAEPTGLRIISFTFGQLGAGETLVVDGRSLTVTLDGANARPSFSGEYIILSPGPQVIRYTDSQEDREVDIEVRRRERWA
jgi:hypothetical protein